MNFKVDFQDVITKQDIINQLTLTFKLPYSTNWDSFEDWFVCLDSDSEIVANSNPIPEEVHLIIKNIDAVKKIEEMEWDGHSVFDNLLDVLNWCTNKENRGDGIIFTYELA